MIDVEEFVLELDNNTESKNFKLATVTDLFDNKTAKIKFDGEDAASEKQYAYLESYKPVIDDRVLLGVLGGTYVILGKVNYNVSPPSEVEADRYLFDLKKVIMQKGLKVTLGTETDTLTVNNGATVVGNVGVNGNVNAVDLSATGKVTASGQVQGASLSTTGTLSAGASDLDSLDVSGNTVLKATNVSGVLTASNALSHTGSLLMFYNKGNPVARQSVATLTGTVTADQVKDKLNDLITTLDFYGLIRKV